MANKLSETTRCTILERIPDYATMLQEDLEMATIRVIAQDFYIYCERNLFIQDKMTGQIISLVDVINWQQRKLVELILADIAAGRPIRYIILKARQMGISTIVEALGYWWTTTHRNIKAIIMTHDSDSNDALFEMFKRYFENSHPKFQPDRKYNNKKQLVFDVEDKIKEEWSHHIAMCDSPESCGVSHKQPGLASSIRVFVAREGKGRGSMVQFFHGSEVAFWEVKADVASAVMQTIPYAAGTFALLESTANGVGGYFYNMWQSAKRGKGNLKPVFMAWHEHKEYEIEGTCNNIYDEEEISLLEIFEKNGYEQARWDRKILWRRMKKGDFLDDPKKFYQEYPKDDMEAFIASGRPRFDTSMLMKMETYAIEHESHRFGQIVPNASPFSLERYVFEEVPQLMEGNDPTPLKLWELPIKKEPGINDTVTEKYVIAVDVSEGKLNAESTKKENDYSIIDVMKKSNLKTVARWRGHIDPDKLGEVVYAIGMFYNTALVGVEVNNHGLTTIQSLRNKNYPNLYMRKTSEENRFQERTSLMGWRTDRKTKPIIIDNLAQAIREGDIIDLDVVFIRECMTYIRDDQGYTNAQSGQFDDTVMAKAIGLQLSGYESINTDELKDKISKPVKRNQNATTNTNSAFETIANPTKKRSSYAEAIARRRAKRSSCRASRRPR